MTLQYGTSYATRFPVTPFTPDAPGPIVRIEPDRWTNTTWPYPHYGDWFNINGHDAYIPAGYPFSVPRGQPIPIGAWFGFDEPNRAVASHHSWSGQIQAVAPAS